MAAGLCYGSRRGGARQAFHHRVGAYDTETLIGALGELRHFLGGQKATLLSDGLPPTAATRWVPGCAGSGSGPPTIWASRSCATAACPCGEPTTMSLEGANIPAVDRPGG